jgi:hypothetical protein
LLVDGGLKQIWSPNEDAIAFPVMFFIKKSPLPSYTTSTQTNTTQQQQQQQQNAFIDSIVIQEFPLASKKTIGSDEKNSNAKNKNNSSRNSKPQREGKEERLRMYQIDDDTAIPFRARFLPKKHKGKNFIRVCEGKFCAWSQ